MKGENYLIDLDAEGVWRKIMLEWILKNAV
jgi:hypothetical protein